MQSQDAKKPRFQIDKLEDRIAPCGLSLPSLTPSSGSGMCGSGSSAGSGGGTTSGLTVNLGGTANASLPNSINVNLNASGSLPPVNAHLGAGANVAGIQASVNANAATPPVNISVNLGATSGGSGGTTPSCGC